MNPQFLLLCLSVFGTLLLRGAWAQESADGVSVSYQLPQTGPLPQTYRVTLAIVDPKNTEWIVSQFARGVVRTVTAENKGRFSEVWNGLDDNFMPVPPGQYGVKGIYMAAAKWELDGEYHSITPRYVTSASAWRALPGESKTPIVVGDPVNSPIGDVDVSASGSAVFCYQYLENARNFFMADLSKPVSYEQATPGYNSGGAAGGKVVATDGLTAWCAETEGFVFRTDGRRFGTEDGKYRKGVHQPEGLVSAMAAWRNEAAGKSVVYLAERGKLLRDPKRHAPLESTTDFVNQIVALDGDSAAPLARLGVTEPMGLVARWGDRLWVLHKEGTNFAVSFVELQAGLPNATLQRAFLLPPDLNPSDMEVDSRGRVYFADAGANKVFQFSSTGSPLRTFGRLPRQLPAKYDPETFMSPEKLACWKDAEGKDRLVVVERHGPDRVSEWSADEGTLLREWLSAQTYANAGYAIDSRNPGHLYIQGHGGWLLRFGIDYKTGQWRTEAVWPDVCTGRFEHQHFGFPKMFYRGDTRYLAWSRGHFIYRESGEHWLPSAALLSEGVAKERAHYMWHDANGDGQVQEEEYRPFPTEPPRGTLRYWGNSWLEDLSLVAIQEGTPDVWRLAPESFDPHGNPVFAPDGWKKLLTDPVLEARQKGTATALFGGNEMGDRFSSPWSMVAGSIREGFYVNARGGADLSANFGAQHKLSRYVPDGKGGYRLAWRTGRVALQGTAASGEVYGSINVMAPIGGLVTQIDQSRMGVHLYTEEGLFVETLFPDERKVGAKSGGIYTQPGEFFTGYSFANKDDGKVYLALGKVTPALFEAEGWTTGSNPVRPLREVQHNVTLPGSRIAEAPEFALALRKQRTGGTTARVALFAPLPGGGPRFDGSLDGWETCEPVMFQADENQKVEVRCGFDPSFLYLRWQLRLGRKFEPKPLEPAERIFTHDRAADTLSFYLQGDPAAAPSKNNDGRPGDTRFVFGLFQDKDTLRPAVLGMFPKWRGKGRPSPMSYKTPAGGTAAFEHVSLLSAVKLTHKLDPDGQGYVLCAAIPRAELPVLPAFTGAFRTLVNFDATTAGHNRFWWSNADGSASRETYDEPTEARFYPGSWAQAKFDPMESLPIRTWSAIGPFGFPKLQQLRHREDRNEITRTLGGTVFPPEHETDLSASYEGEQTQTRKGARTLKWKPALTSGDRLALDSVLGWNGFENEGSAYLVSWVHAKEEATVRLKLIDEHGHHAVRIWLNGRQLPSTFPKGQNANFLSHSLDPELAVQLAPGWNKLLLRYDLVWGGTKIGLRLEAPTEVLWGLRFSGTPPASGR
jgi:hypothetical protein